MVTVGLILIVVIQVYTNTASTTPRMTTPNTMPRFFINKPQSPMRRASDKVVKMSVIPPTTPNPRAMKTAERITMARMVTTCSRKGLSVKPLGRMVSSANDGPELDCANARSGSTSSPRLTTSSVVAGARTIFRINLLIKLQTFIRRTLPMSQSERKRRRPPATMP